MTAPTWPLTADATTPAPACHVCGGALPESGVIYAQPHRYHRACHERFHMALWAKENEGKTIETIRQLVGEDVKKGRQ